MPKCEVFRHYFFKYIFFQSALFILSFKDSDNTNVRYFMLLTVPETLWSLFFQPIFSLLFILIWTNQYPLICLHFHWFLCHLQSTIDLVRKILKLLLLFQLLYFQFYNISLVLYIFYFFTEVFNFSFKSVYYCSTKHLYNFYFKIFVISLLMSVDLLFLLYGFLDSYITSDFQLYLEHLGIMLWDSGYYLTFFIASSHHV